MPPAYRLGTFNDKERIHGNPRLYVHHRHQAGPDRGVLQSRGDLSLDAGRDVTVAAVEDRQGQTRWSTSRLQSVTQLGAEVSAGRDLNVSAGRDLTAVASTLEARRDIALSAR